MKPEQVSISLGKDYPEIRDSVRRICADFPNEYWKRLDEAEAYPKDFVDALTRAGYLGALIPEEYGGAGLPLRAWRSPKSGWGSCRAAWERRTCRARWASGARRN